MTLDILSSRDEDPVLFSTDKDKGQLEKKSDPDLDLTLIRMGKKYIYILSKQA